MSTIVTRSGKGSPLTHAEVDSNFTNLNTDKLELSGGTLTGTLNFGDNVKAQFGASADLQVYHDGSNSYIKDAGTGNLVIGATNFKLMDAATNEYYMEAIANGQVLLYHDNAVKFQTTSTGIDVTGTVVADGLTVDGDAKVDGFALDGKADASTTYFRFQENASSFGYNGTYIEYDGSANELIFGRHDVSDTNTANDKAVMSFQRTTGDISFYEDTGTTAKLIWDASAEALEFGDNVKAKFGASSDLQVFHDGSNSWINEVGTGNLLIGGGNEVRITSPSAGEFMATFSNNGPVNLYYDNSKKLETTANGIAVTGSVDFGNWTITESGGSLYFATGGTNKMKLDASGNLQVVGSVDANATIT